MKAGAAPVIISQWEDVLHHREVTVLLVRRLIVRLAPVDMAIAQVHTIDHPIAHPTLRRTHIREARRAYHEKLRSRAGQDLVPQSSIPMQRFAR